jgi:hypothetical protein
MIDIFNKSAPGPKNVGPDLRSVVPKINWKRGSGSLGWSKNVSGSAPKIFRGTGTLKLSDECENLYIYFLKLRFFCSRFQRSLLFIERKISLKKMNRK